MTILPKKKASKDKPDAETTDHSHSSTHNHSHNHNHSHSHYHHPSASETRHDKGARGRTSPTRWLASTSREDVPTHDPGGTFENGESSSLTSSHNKRRHRSSPHRTVRKHRGHSANVPPLSPHSPSAGPSQECEDAYNSEDEHCPPTIPEDIEEAYECCTAKIVSETNWFPQDPFPMQFSHYDRRKPMLEQWFDKALKEKKGFLIKKMKEDGACLFRAVADQVYGDQEMHACLRKHCIDYMTKNAEFFSQYVTEDFTTYLNRKRMESCHGNHLEMQAMCELFNRPIEVYQYSIDPINTFHSTYKTDNEPVRISYHGGVHYNSVIDPYKATIGVGLGLPGLQPGLAEKNLMKDAVRVSENSHIEKTMLEDKIRETDWELTQETIEEQVARESYLQWLKEQEKQANKQGTGRSASATCSSSSEYTHSLFESSGSPETRGGRSPRLRSGQNSAQNSPQRMEGVDTTLPHSAKPVSPAAGCSQSPKVEQTLLPNIADLESQGAVGGSFEETASIMNHIPPSMLGLSEWDEDDILAQVIAQSQQEYLDSLKKNNTPSNQSGHLGDGGATAGCSTHDGLSACFQYTDPS